MTSIQTNDLVDVLPGDGWRGWDRMIRRKVFKQLTRFTHFLKTDENDGIDQMRGIQTIGQVHVPTGDGWKGSDRMIRREVFKQLTRFTYFLEMDEEDGIGWSDESIPTIDQVHVPTGDGWRGWDRMIRWEIFKQFTKFTYWLETDEEDGMGGSDEGYSNNWLSSRTG